MIGKAIESHFAPGFSVERRNLIQRKQVTLGGLASIEVQQDHRLSIAPCRQVLFFRRRAVQLERGIRRDLHLLRGEHSRGLMMSVATVHATPAVNHKVRTKFADHTDHIVEDLVAPDPLRLLRRLRIAKILAWRKVQPHAVAACCRQQFLRVDQTKLGGLFGAKIVLPALAASEREQCNVGVEASCEVGEDGARFVVGMRRDVKDARGNPSAFYRLNRFRQAGTCSGRRRQLGERESGQKRCGCTANQNANRQTLKIGIHATSTATELRILTVNRQPPTPNLQRAIVSFPARESETPTLPERFPPIPTFASARSARRATPTRSSSAPRAGDTATS